MYSMLIVDDESVVVNGLAYDIDWNKLNIKEVYKAYSGQQALEYLNNNKIDIVITDIRMPGFNGLEIADRIRIQWPYAKVILISGYDEFQYAKKAIDLGVFGYVMKPIPYDEIKEIVVKAKHAIENELEKEKIIEEAEEELAGVIPILQERCLNNLIVKGYTNLDDQSKQLKACQLPLDVNKPSFIILIKIDEWVVKPVINKKEIYEIALQNITREILLKKKNVIFLIDPEGNQIVVVQRIIEGELEELMKYITLMAKTFQYSVQRSLGCIVSIFWGGIVPTMNELSISYQGIVDKAYHEIAWFSGRIMGPEKTAESSQKRELGNLVDYRSLLLLVESGRKDQVLQYIDKIFKEFGKGQFLLCDNILEIYNIVSGILVQASIKNKIAVKEWAGDELKCFYNFEQLSSVSELKLWCISAIKKYMNYQLNREKSHANRLIEQAKEIIIETLDKEISLINIASQLYLHPNYLSRLFKEKEGVSITDYRIMMKMIKAEELLSKPGVKVYEVAEQIGYNSVAHFSRIFKRETGMTPKEFQYSLITPA